MKNYLARYKLVIKNEIPHFVLQSPNHRVIGTSETYYSIQAARKGIAAVRELVKDIANFYRMESTNGQHYFLVKGKNGEVVLTSETYKTFAMMKKGITSVMTHGITEEVFDIAA